MQWQNILGHERQRRWFELAILRNRMASTFLLVGRNGIGKRTFARMIAKTLLCTERLNDTFEPCNRCEGCVQVDAKTHPDLLELARDPGKSALSIVALVGTIQNRLREGICYELNQRPFCGPRRIGIIDDADTIDIEAANSMLKTLEEPPGTSVIFLISNNEQSQLPTVRSRCQIVRFQPLSNDNIASILISEGLCTESAAASEIATMSHGSVSHAIELQENDALEIRNQTIDLLNRRPMDFGLIAYNAWKWVQNCKDESQLRRNRMHTFFTLIEDYYRNILFKQTGVGDRGSLLSDQQFAQLPELTILTAANGMLQCNRTHSDIDRNLTQQAILENWAASQSELCRA